METRRSARAILLNSENQIFLFKFQFGFLSGEKTLWVTPGGGINKGETFEEGLKRELYEELGIKDEIAPKWVYKRNRIFEKKDGSKFLSEERYYLVRIEKSDFNFDGWEESEKKYTRDWKWWSVEDIRMSGEEFFCDKLGDILEELIKGDLEQIKEI